MWFLNLIVYLKLAILSEKLLPEMFPQLFKPFHVSLRLKGLSGHRTNSKKQLPIANTICVLQACCKRFQPLAHQTLCIWTCFPEKENYLERHLSECSNAVKQEHKTMPKIYLVVLIVEEVPHSVLFGLTTTTFFGNFLDIDRTGLDNNTGLNRPIRRRHLEEGLASFASAGNKSIGYNRGHKYHNEGRHTKS